MKCLILFAAIVVVSSAVPVFIDHDGDTVHIPQSHIRIRRATCDLLSFSTPIGQLNHAACAAHCLVIGNGYRGGFCENGVCHCRK